MQRFSMKVVLCSIVINVAANAVLIPQLSYIGTALATVVTELFVLVVEFYYLHRMGYGIDLVETIAVPAASLLIATVVAWAAMSAGLGIFVAAAVALIVYGVIMLFIGIKKDDWALIMNIVKRD